MVTAKQLRSRVNFLQQLGFDIQIGWAYGRPACTNLSESETLSPRLPPGQMMDWLSAYEKGSRAKKTNAPKLLTQIEFVGDDFDAAEQIAHKLGYQQTAYTSSSDLIGLFCLPENPEHGRGPYRGGCIIKTQEFGFVFVQIEEDINNG